MKGVVKSMAIGIDKMIDRDQMHLEVLNRMPVNMLAITAKRSESRRGSTAVVRWFV